MYDCTIVGYLFREWVFLHLANHFFNEVLILLLAYLLCRYAQVSSEIIIVVIFSHIYIYLVEVSPCLIFLGVGSQEADSLFDVASFILNKILCSRITHF